MKILKDNFIVKFVVTLFLVGLLVGFVFYMAYKPDLGGSIENFKGLVTSTHQNTFLSSIVLISGIFVLSVSIVGLPAILFYVFYEGLAIGYTLGSFIWLFHFKGFLFYILFFITSKLIYILIMGYFVILSTRYISKFLDSFFSKNREELYKTIVYHFYRFTIVLGATIVNCLAVYFISNKIIESFINLL